MQDKKETAEKEMNDLLIDLSTTKYWEAIVRFNKIRVLSVDMSMRYLDPLTQATNISRNQGMRLGFLTLEDFVSKEVKNRQKKNK